MNRKADLTDLAARIYEIRNLIYTIQAPAGDDLLGDARRLLAQAETALNRASREAAPGTEPSHMERYHEAARAARFPNA